MADRNNALDRARTFVTLLVLANHAVVSYTAFGRYYPNHYLWSTAPIVDQERWIGFNILTLFNDAFFMSLMFLLSGLFVVPSLKRKGAAGFLRDRAFRLGVPFLALIFVLMPVAYYASYRLSAGKLDFIAFWYDSFEQGVWFDGPGWFIWFLLALDILAIPVVHLAPRAISAITRLSSSGYERPMRFALLLFLAAVGAYLPMLLEVGAVRWFNWGPFQVQLSRVALYGVFFFAGAAIGAGDIEMGLLARKAQLAQRWRTWAAAAATSFILLSYLINFRRMRMANLTGAPPLWWQTSYGIVYALACTLICLAVLSLFIRFGQAEKSFLDPLRDDAYCIYIVHYVFVLWIQYALLDATALGAIPKASIAFAGTLLASWAATKALRALPGAKHAL